MNEKPRFDWLSPLKTGLLSGVIALFLVLGWGTWIPGPWHGRALGLGAASLVIFDLVTLAAYQLPFYYG